MLPTHVIGAFIKILIIPFTNCVTCDVSLVIRVISDPLSILSVLSSEKYTIFSNKSYLKSAPMRCDTLLAKIFRVTAKHAPIAVTKSISDPQ
ncbi:hypothetical protein SDC9_171663 [bioreactor metagenome]|uniref:Uncharacterized protein n=1 Tax=bioreactor metagenome TaxID=1076179 RepID=A0A645GBH0_9ZZZZ